MRRSGAASVSSPKRRVNTLAKENPATCQNHTLVKRAPLPMRSPGATRETGAENETRRRAKGAWTGRSWSHAYPREDGQAHHGNDQERGVENHEVETDVAVSRAEKTELHRVLVREVREPCGGCGQDQKLPGNGEERHEDRARDCRQQRVLDEHGHVAEKHVHRRSHDEEPLRAEVESMQASRPTSRPLTAASARC